MLGGAVPLQVAAFVGVPAKDSGLAAGLISTSQKVGGALGVAVVATIVFGRIAGPSASTHGDTRPRHGRAGRRLP